MARPHFVGPALLLTLAMTGPAFAHAHLEASIPPARATVTEAPSMLRLTFSEGIEPKFTTVKLTAAGGEAVAVKSLEADPTDPKRVTVTLAGPLKPGTYRVEWRAVSEDTDKTHGSYSFTVAP